MTPMEGLIFAAAYVKYRADNHLSPENAASCAVVIAAEFAKIQQANMSPFGDSFAEARDFKNQA